MSFPSFVLFSHTGLYQSAQNITNGHLCTACCEVPEDTRKEMLRLQAEKSQPGGGKKFWAEMAQIQGVYEDCHGLRFRPPRLGSRLQQRDP